VFFVPALTGLGSPWWDADARGVISGITRGTTRSLLVRAGLEAIAHQVADVVDALPEPPAVLRADGGATGNGFLMQFQADLLGVPVEVAAERETTALGAAALAAGRGARVAVGATYEPQIGADERAALRAAWRVALNRSRT
jgi:glycerol kinase